MFGNKKAKFEEQIKEVFAEIHEQREYIENRASEVEEVSTCIHAEVCQVMENTNDLVNHVMLNVEEESSFLHSIDEFSKDLKVVVDEYAMLREAMEQQVESVTALVEENKHYTTPAKYLTETPNALRETYQGIETRLEEMGDFGKQMGVLALNAAIEAGRIGDGAKQFVSAAEQIRQNALLYEKAAVSLKEELDSSKEKITELEDTIHHLVALIKESNMGTARLMKKSMETNKLIHNSSMRDFTEDMILLRDKVVGIRNLDEEVAKIGERNRIQLSDIQEDILSQKKEITEIESDIAHLFGTAEEKLQ